MYIDSNTTKVFFTADTHFGHANVIKYCDRPYVNTDGMNADLITNWNSVVSKDDIVFHLGDVSFQKEFKDLSDTLHALNGKIFIVPGNHDSIQRLQHPSLQDKVTVLSPLFDVDIQVEDEKMRFVLCHYSMNVWNKSHYGAIQLYGHSHGTLPEQPNTRSMDVGVDCHNYTPISLDDVLLKMYKKVFKPKDHHKERTK